MLGIKGFLTLFGFLFFYLIGSYIVPPTFRGEYLHRSPRTSIVDTLSLSATGEFRYRGQTGVYWPDGNGYMVLETKPYPSPFVVHSQDTLVGLYAPMLGRWIRTRQTR